MDGMHEEHLWALPSAGGKAKNESLRISLKVQRERK